jgi:hypothetical protein
MVWNISIFGHHELENEEKTKTKVKEMAVEFKKISRQPFFRMVSYRYICQTFSRGFPLLSKIDRHL